MTVTMPSAPEGGRRGLSAPTARSAVATVLVVVDDREWSRSILPSLGADGFHCVVDASAEHVHEPARVRGIDVAIIDLGLRSRSGIAACAAFRTRSPAPILATGRSLDETALLAAFAAGADQFVAAGASAREVVARLRSLLRRVPPGTRAVAAPSGPIVLDEETRTARVGGTTVVLSTQEFEVLRALVRRPGRVVTRRELVVSTLLGDGRDRTLDFVIRRLRQKLEAAGDQRRITAVRGVGFRFEVDGPGPARPDGG